MLVILLTVSFGFSQSSLGVICSINSAKLSHESFQYDGFLSLDSKIFSSVGIVYKYGFNPNWSVTTGVNYTRRGVESKINESVKVFGMPIEIGAVMVHKMDYVEVPALVEYKFANNNWKIKPYLFAGPMFAYETGYNIGVKANFIVKFNLFDYDVDLDNDVFNKIDISGVAGAGFSIPINKGSINFDARYVYGLTDILDDPIIDLDISHRNLRVSATYLYGF